MSVRLDTMILKILSKKEMYGYEIISELRKVSDDRFCLKTGTLYPLLQKMVSDKLIVIYQIKSDEQKRTFYKITTFGREQLKKETQNWITYSNAVNKVLGI